MQTAKGNKTMTDHDLEKQRLEEEERKRRERDAETLEQKIEILRKRKRGGYNDNRIDEDDHYYD